MPRFHQLSTSLNAILSSPKITWLDSAKRIMFVLLLIAALVVGLILKWDKVRKMKHSTTILWLLVSGKITVEQEPRSASSGHFKEEWQSFQSPTMQVELHRISMCGALSWRRATWKEFHSWTRIEDSMMQLSFAKIDTTHSCHYTNDFN